jgi:hypothetical protein
MSVGIAAERSSSGTAAAGNAWAQRRQPMNPETLSGEAGWLLPAAPLLAVFFVCFWFIGMPLGVLLGSWLAGRQAANDLRSAGVYHVPKLSENRVPLVVNLTAQCRIFVGLLLLKCKLLLKQALLKTVGKARRQPSPQQCAENSAANTGEKNFVCHKRVMTANDPSSATRRKGGVD